MTQTQKGEKKMKWFNGYRMRLVFLGVIAAVVFGPVEPVNGSIIAVGPGVSFDYDTIQAGIDAANDGDTVLVVSEEYVVTEPITFRGKAITVKSEAGPDQTTIRMGTPTDPKRASVVVFESNETAASVLEGFTITGGRGVCFPSVGAFGGGGILFDASSGTVRDCTIVQNQVQDSGGGVLVYSGSSVTLTNCILRGNSATKDSGGGVFCFLNSSATLTNCTIVENSSAIGGGGVTCDLNSSMTLTGCTISENSTVLHGVGGVFCGENASLIITHCSITKNSGGNECGGIMCWEYALMTVTNSIVWGNTSPHGNEVGAMDGGRISISYSDVAGGQAEAHVDSGCMLNWGEGNIDVDPCFADPDNDDYHLKSEAGRWNPNSQTWIQDNVTSPCIDAGDPISPIGWELFPNGGFINMGAYGGTSKASKSYFGEPVCETIVAGDINGDGHVNRTDLEIMALHWTDDEPLPLP